jgi:hypothetical protein
MDRREFVGALAGAPLVMAERPASPAGAQARAYWPADRRFNNRRDDGPRTAEPSDKILSGRNAGA